jgi:hypothetical protein
MHAHGSARSVEGLSTTLPHRLPAYAVHTLWHMAPRPRVLKLGGQTAKGHTECNAPPLTQPLCHRLAHRSR